MIHTTKFAIRSYHTDAFGHVNNSRYLELLEEARWRYAEAIGLVELLAQQDLGFIIMDLRLRFRAPIREGETLEIHTSLITLGSASGEVQQWANKSGHSQVALKSLFHFILIQRSSGVSVPIEGDIRRLLCEVIEVKSGGPLEIN